MFRKIFIVGFCLALVLNVTFMWPLKIKADNVDIPGYDMITENANFEMYFNQENADVAIKDKMSGYMWNTIPPEWEKDFSKGFAKNNLASHIMISTFDNKGRSEEYNSYSSCVKKKTFQYKKIEDGIRVNYVFKQQGISIAIEFRLTKNGMDVKIPVNSIKDRQDFGQKKIKDQQTKSSNTVAQMPAEEDIIQLNQIKVLPFFGAAAKSSDGYILIPDGSGALIRFDDNFGNYAEISKPVYGWDKAIEQREMPPLEETFRLPVFGIKKDNTAVLGIIDGGDAASAINAGIAGNLCGYFRTYPAFIYRDINKFMLFEGGMQTGETTTSLGGISERFVYKMSPVSLSTDITVHYYLLKYDNASYSGMANTYRQYLVNEKKIRIAPIPDDMYFALSLIGGVQKRKIVWGIPRTVMEPLTTFKQARIIIEELKKRGINDISVRYMGINSGGYKYKITDQIRPAGELGGTRGLKDLIHYTVENNIALFPNGEFLEIYKEGNGFSGSKDAVRLANNAVAFQWQWDIVSGRREPGSEGYFLLSPARLPNISGEFKDSLQRFDLVNVAVDSIGDMIYSQYKKNELAFRDKVKTKWEDVLGNLAKQMNRVIVTGGNAYTLPYITEVWNAPLDTSEFLIETEQVPFYEMVVHGLIPYTAPPSNLRHDQSDEFLKMVEYGAIPHYQWIYEQSSVLKRTDYDDLFSMCYHDWVDNAVKEYNEVKKLYKGTYDKRIISHEKLHEGIYRTIYEGDISVVVNYTGEDYIVNARVVKAHNYIVQGVE
ncbi:DUF5696 domain-containing protein [Mahella australiensis]|uniref:Uncharacterized protein n=1 Tax=Mahella australiensis (strain DSM 15567 / CIP 107919 / 50-1 BON) TaxID=697281 RepID=F4A0T2_MAHA5|nr:DUF5696 domain-containing protein [Mahella australiensis]AEE96978.1 hypothetical protein Mahau_1797 [Mahella australiensis 50-1 BON]